MLIDLAFGINFSTQHPSWGPAVTRHPNTLILELGLGPILLSVSAAFYRKP